MQKTGPDAAAGDEAAAQGRRLGARSDRRRHRAAPARSCSDSADAVGLPVRQLPTPPRLVEHELDVAVQLQERRRQLRRDRARAPSARRTAPSTSRSRSGRSAAPGGSSPCPSTALRAARARHRRRTAPRCCAASTAVSVTRCVRACSARAGSLKPMWPLVPMPRICRSIPPAAAIAVLVARALRLGIRRRAVEEVDPLRRQVDAREQMLLHERAVAARDVAGPMPSELVEIERRGAGEVGLPVRVQRAELVIQAGSACGPSAGRAPGADCSRSCAAMWPASAFASARSSSNVVMRSDAGRTSVSQSTLYAGTW